MRYQDQLFQQRENALLESARQLFQNDSWDRVTIAEVARHAGIGKGTVYKHFTSKEALYARMVLDCSRQHLAELQEVARNAVNVHVHNLRRKLGADVVETVRGLGSRCGWARR